jgi:phosphodiesterase/alkaline phosphatase D-like protein
MPELQAKLKAEGANCAFLDAKLLLQATPSEKWATDVLPAVLEIFRAVYRRTWSWGATAAVLANCANIMIPDDHEFRDDWGDKPGDYDRQSHDFFLAHAAYQVYREYQAVLLDDVPASEAARLPAIVPAHITMPQLLSAQGVGLLAIDSRVKSFQQPAYPYDGAEPTPMLGEEQWRSILTALADGGPLASTRLLIVAAGVPPCWMGSALTEMAASRVDDLRGAWGHPRNQPELIKLLEALCAWKASVLSRQVVVVAGDVHCGAITDIKKNGSTIFQQLTASPIANKIMSRSQRVLAVLAEELDTSVNFELSFDHILHEHRCQFGVVTVPGGPYASGKGNPSPILELVGVGEHDEVSKALRDATNVVAGQRSCCTVT